MANWLLGLGRAHALWVFDIDQKQLFIIKSSNRIAKDFDDSNRWKETPNSPHCWSGQVLNLIHHLNWQSCSVTPLKNETNYSLDPITMITASSIIPSTSQIGNPRATDSAILRAVAPHVSIHKLVVQYRRRKIKISLTPTNNRHIRFHAHRLSWQYRSSHSSNHLSPIKLAISVRVINFFKETRCCLRLILTAIPSIIEQLFMTTRVVDIPKDIEGSSFLWGKCIWAGLVEGHKRAGYLSCGVPGGVKVSFWGLGGGGSGGGESKEGHQDRECWNVDHFEGVKSGVVLDEAEEDDGDGEKTGRKICDIYT